jgi:large subunit ribosomal protein L28
MAHRCEVCGKGPSYGNVVSHANNTRRRRWNANLRSVRALVLSNMLPDDAHP